MLKYFGKNAFLLLKNDPEFFSFSLTISIFARHFTKKK